MESNNSVSKIEAFWIPTTEDAVAAYKAVGGQLTHCSEFGTDPLGHDPQREERETQFHMIYRIFESLFHKVVNGDGTDLSAAITLFIQLTVQIM